MNQYIREETLRLSLKEKLSRQESYGDDLSQKRPIEHYLTFQNRVDYTCFMRVMYQHGFTNTLSGYNHQENNWRAIITRSDCLLFDTIAQVIQEVETLSEKHNGVYDGWSSITVKKK
ncbi:hypothetical protein IGI37_002464 [Enterococcus sp. AZ194]|uniref:ribonuclease E inhibitor RraB n=1 Tax=Enterococcus sp. AZ194 TaxID=2774629 RepID=UPI003F23ADD3